MTVHGYSCLFNKLIVKWKKKCQRCFLDVLIRLASSKWLLSILLGVAKYTPSKLWLLSKEGHRFADNMRRIFNWSYKEPQFSQLLRQNIKHYIYLLFDTGTSLRWIDRIKVEGVVDLKEKVNQVESENRPLILITAHIGNWELVGRYVSLSTKKTFYALAKPLRAKWLNVLLRNIRERLNIQILWTGKGNFQRLMLKILANKDAVGFVMDQKPEGRLGPKVEFMGKPAEFVAGPARFAIRYQCPVISVFCVRIGFLKYKILSNIILKPDHKKSNIEAVTQLFARELEPVIKAYPEQWCWSYKRWKD